MGQALLIQVQKLVSNDVCMGWVDVFSGGLEDEECLSKNEISSRPLLGGVCFGISLMFRLYRTHLFCSHLFTGLCSPCAETIFINNIFAVQRKKFDSVSFLKNTKNRTKHNQLRVYWFEH
jgi:hypothetical protein